MSGDWLCISKRSDSQEMSAYYNLVNGEEYEYPGYLMLVS